MKLYTAYIFVRRGPELNKAKRKLFNSIICVICVLSLGIGAVGISNFAKDKEPEEVETVNDSVEVKKDNLQINAKAAALMDAATGTVIYEQNAHDELPFASVTKIMTMLLTMDAVKAGKAKLTDQVNISEYASSMGGSQMYLEMGESHTLEELLQGIAIVSANDACVAVSEYIAGSEEVFVEKMNKKAQELKMMDTHFENTNGLPVAGHVSSAYDIGVMGCALLKYDEPKEWFNTWQKDIQIGLPGKEKSFTLTNTNKLLKQYKGANGVKTGFTQEAGYCLCASATREDTTLVAVVLGAETAKIRNAEVAKLLDYGFANYQSKVLAIKGQKMKTIKLDKGEPYHISAVTEKDASAFIEKGNEDGITYKVKISNNISLPLKKGDRVGVMTIYDKDKKISEVNLVSDQDAKKVSFVTYCDRKVKNLFSRKEKK